MLKLILSELYCVCVFQVPNPAPPPLPVRNASMRTGLSSACSEIESRFYDYFHLVHEFPTPQPFQRVFKVYSSRPGKLLLLSQSHSDYVFSFILSSAYQSTKCRLCYNFLPSYMLSHHWYQWSLSVHVGCR